MVRCSSNSHGYAAPRCVDGHRHVGRKLTLYDRSLDMHVSNLRKKIGPHADGRPRIVALRSRGYYYCL